MSRSIGFLKELQNLSLSGKYSFLKSYKITEKLIPFLIANADSHGLEIVRISQDTREGDLNANDRDMGFYLYNKGKDGPLKTEL